MPRLPDKNYTIKEAIESCDRDREGNIRELKDRIDYLFKNIDQTYDIPTPSEVPMLHEILIIALALTNQERA